MEVHGEAGPGRRERWQIMERMNALDAGFFFSEDARAPLHIASVTVLEGPAPTLEELTELTAAKLDQLPRYRQRVRTVPFGLGLPFWADDERFDLAHHIRHTAVPPPGGPDELRDTAGRILSQPLDMHRSPWEIWLIEGLAEGRWALVMKVHHCVVDGVGAADLMTVLFSLVPEPPPPPVPGLWRPAPAPSGMSLLGAALRADVTEPLAKVTGLARGIGGLRDIRGFLLGLPRSVQRVAHRTPASLGRPVGPHRRWLRLTAELSEIKTIRAALGGTVNDVVLTAVTRGFRELLAARDDLTDATVVRAMVPVSVRAEGEHGVLANRISAVIVDLPCHEPDPARRLFLIRGQTDDLKRTHQAVSGDALIQLAGLAPTLLTLASRAVMAVAKPMFQTVVTNVPGPQFPLYVLGRRVVELYPYVPIAAGIQASIGVLSYLGRCYFGISGDLDSTPDLEVLTKGIEAGFAELLAGSRPYEMPVPPATRQSPSNRRGAPS